MSETQLLSDILNEAFASAQQGDYCIVSVRNIL